MGKSSDKRLFNFEKNPYTMVFDKFIDETMHKYPGSVTRVYLAILRKTIGWQKLSAEISYDCIAGLTGISDPTTISKAIKILIEEGHIIKIMGSWKPKKSNFITVIVDD